ncbi:MAG: hypothetical protein JWM39_719 [Parcubacteria group bacterium]|nr:hypothetical protein [Parcubacteria group bacterium]
MQVETEMPATERSLFQAIVTAKKVPPHFCGGADVTLQGWFSLKLTSDDDDDLSIRCTKLQDAVPGLTFMDHQQQAVVLTCLLEQKVHIHSVQSLRNAKRLLARQIEEHLKIITTIQ